MSEELHISGETKEERYQSFIPKIKALVGNESDIIANLSNVASALHFNFNFFWTGFYIVKNDELVLGPFQGPIACTRIAKGKGVCGTAWEKKETLVVKNVDEFPGHIACSSDSKSEIVVPVIKNGNVIAVLDVDSKELATFDEIDAKYLNELIEWLSGLF